MSPENDERTRTLNAYCELGLIDRHFNNAQTNCRALASTWMLAGLAGIGVVISKELSVQFSKELIIAAIGLASAVGLCLIWMMDLLVYQRLLDSAFIEAKNLENEQPWLPQVRNNMRDILKGWGLPLVSMFYIVTAETMILISGVALAMWLHPLRQRRIAFWAELLVYALIFVRFPVYMYRKTSRTPNLEEIIAEARKARQAERASNVTDS